MQPDNLYRAETKKSIPHFLRDFEEIARKSGFTIHNPGTMDMAHTFALHGAETPAGFDLHMVQLCKPEKAAKSLAANPERAVLMPKFVMAFGQNGTTQIRFLRFSAEDISAVVDDPVFPGSLAVTYDRITAMIDEARG